MTDRIDSHMDEATERVIEQARAFLAARPAPDLTAGVMRRIEQLGVRPARPGLWDAPGRLAERIWAPRHVEMQWRPAYALIAAAAVLLLFMFLPSGWRTSTVRPPVLAAADTEPRLFVQFRLDAADAMDVRLAGSFTNWQPRYELHQASPGIWTITLPLSAGVHDYVFVVDGQRWIPDPYAQQVDDGFGGVNSRIALVPPDTPRL
jgi:hypothetical protein